MKARKHSDKKSTNNYQSNEKIKEIRQKTTDIIEWTRQCKNQQFMKFEKGLIGKVFALGCLLVQLFLITQEQKWQQGYIRKKGEKLQENKGRIFRCVFGEVKYWRTYVYRAKEKQGYFALDILLGLPLDGFSMILRSFATRIATKMSYEQTVVVLTLILGWSPCQKTIEEMVIGLGRYTERYFESAPAPENDGEVLIVQIDGKGVPMATEEELEKRRGKRAENSHKNSKRHRGKEKRKCLGKKKRKEKGDQSKNAKMATLVVMYTLRISDDGTLLEGPINKKVYASFAPKRHAVAIARREADKRGFNQGDGKLVQVVTDGDNDLALYIEEYFPEAIHTIDYYHVCEYLWEAGGALYKEGDNERNRWFKSQKNLLYGGRVSKIIKDLKEHLDRLATRGPGMSKRRECILKVINYLEKRRKKMNYKALRKQDLEIGSGAVEGAVKYVIAKRFDHGGMRWIKERAETLLQLRCVEVNGDWDKFIEFVHKEMLIKTKETQKNIFLKSCKLPPLPTYGLAA